MQPVRRSEFIDFIKDQFAFLTELHQFEGPQVEQDSWTIRVTYLRGDAGLGIEIHMDLRDLVNAVYVVRLSSREVPSAFLFDHGNRVRIHLLELIREQQLEVDRPRLAMLTTRTTWKDRKNPSFPTNELQSLAQTLRECIAEILRRRDSLF